MPERKVKIVRLLSGEIIIGKFNEIPTDAKPSDVIEVENAFHVEYQMQDDQIKLAMIPFIPYLSDPKDGIFKFFMSSFVCLPCDAYSDIVSEYKKRTSTIVTPDTENIIKL
jgi:hypothetical protein